MTVSAYVHHFCELSDKYNLVNLLVYTFHGYAKLVKISVHHELDTCRTYEHMISFEFMEMVCFTDSHRQFPAMPGGRHAVGL